MHAKLSALIESLDDLSDSILNSSLPNQSFDTRHGWNYPHISPVDLTNTISNIVEKLNQYKKNELPDEFLSTIDGLIENIKKQTNDIKQYLVDDAGRISVIVPSILFLLQIINNEIDAQLFSWDSINTNKLVPKNLKNRLRALDSQLNNLETDCSDIDIKVKTINSAYETAESLPAVIQDLNDAREKLSSTIQETRDDINKYKNEISEIKVYINFAKSESISMRDEIKELLAKTDAYSKSASSLVEQCDDALQILTIPSYERGVARLLRYDRHP